MRTKFLVLAVAVFLTGCAATHVRSQPTPAVDEPVQSWHLIKTPPSVKTETAVKTVVRDVSIKGTSERATVVGALIESYFDSVRVSRVADTGAGVYVTVTGPKGTEKIHFSDKLVAKIKALQANPKAGQGLMAICPTQGGQLQKAIGNLKVTETTKTTLSQGETTPVCKEGVCHAPNPNGRYIDHTVFGGVRVVVVRGNAYFPQNTVSGKLECYNSRFPKLWGYGSGFGPVIVVRNPTVSVESLLSTNGNALVQYLERVWPLKYGQGCPKDGTSCFEVTLFRNGEIYRDDSPPEARFRQK